MAADIVIYFFVAFVGLFFGSFLNVLADRLSQGRTILGRSKCDSCHHTLAWYDLIPVISYTVLQAKCRYCKAPLSLGYPASEIMTSGFFLLTYILSTHNYFDPRLHIIHLIIVAILIVMFLADIRYQILPDEMEIALFVVAVSRIVVIYSNSSILVGLRDHGVAAIVVMIPLLLVFLLSKGRGMGFGDVKYAINMGLLLGLWSGLAALYLAFILGGIAGGLILLSKKGSMKSKIAFGPFLILGTYLMVFYEQDILLILSRIYQFGP